MKKLMIVLFLAVSTAALGQSVVDQADGFEYTLDVELDSVVIVESDLFYQQKYLEISSIERTGTYYESWWGIHISYSCYGYKYIFSVPHSGGPRKVAIIRE